MNVNASLENITYRLATLDDSEKLVDFFFDVFLPGIIIISYFSQNEAVKARFIF